MKGTKARRRVGRLKKRYCSPRVVNLKFQVLNFPSRSARSAARHAEAVPSSPAAWQPVARQARDEKKHGRVVRSGKLDRARSRLYRSHILQENMRLKALAEIYKMQSFALLQNHIFF